MLRIKPFLMTDFSVFHGGSNAAGVGLVIVNKNKKCFLTQPILND